MGTGVLRNKVSRLTCISCLSPYPAVPRPTLRGGVSSRLTFLPSPFEVRRTVTSLVLRAYMPPKSYHICDDHLAPAALCLTRVSCIDALLCRSHPGKWRGPSTTGIVALDAHVLKNHRCPIPPLLPIPRGEATLDAGRLSLRATSPIVVHRGARPVRQESAPPDHAAATLPTRV